MTIKKMIITNSRMMRHSWFISFTTTTIIVAAMIVTANSCNFYYVLSFSFYSSHFVHVLMRHCPSLSINYSHCCLKYHFYCYYSNSTANLTNYHSLTIIPTFLSSTITILSHYHLHLFVIPIAILSFVTITFTIS